jgi:hypothetical protein
MRSSTLFKKQGGLAVHEEAEEEKTKEFHEHDS